MQQITTSSTLPRITPEDRSALIDARNSLVGDEVTRPLLPDVRHRLSAFLTEAERHRTMAAQVEVEAEISSLMLSFFLARSMSKAEAALITREYVQALRDMPLWAIRQATRKIKDGEVEGASLDFPPAAARLRSVVTEIMEPLLRDRYEVSRILNARIAPAENPGMAARVNRLTKADLLRKYGPNFGIGAPPEPVSDTAPKPRQSMTVEQITAHYATHGLGFKPKVKRDDDRYGDRYDGVTSDDGEAA